MTKIRLKAEVIGADRVARQFSLAAGAMQGDVDDAVQEMGDAAELVFQAFAPFRSGRLHRGIVSKGGGSTAIVTAEAKNPLTGYDYVGVTRFGHGVIVPKDRQLGASVVSTGRRRAFGRRAALRFNPGGGVIFRTRVGAWKPAGDWAEKALPTVKAEAQAIVTRLGRRIEARL